MLRLALGYLLAATALSLAAVQVHAQSAAPQARIQLEAEGTPLADILRALSAQTGIDVVFAERTVQGRAVTGRFIGDDVDLALATILRSSGLRAEQVRSRQYVIVPDMGLGVSVPQPTARGTLEGTVVDAASGEVLPGAHVVLAGLGIGTVTNTAGYFAVAGLPAGDYRVRISYVGYRTTELELPVYPTASPDRPVVRLQPQPVVSDAVVVEGNDGHRGDLEIVPGTARVGIRTASSLPSVLGEGDLFAALEWVPGVARAGEAGGELVVRGAEAQYNRYLLDGAPVMHPWHTFGLFSILQPEALKSVHLHKGSFPAEYGGGLSAILDVEMRDGERQRAAGVVAISPVSARGVAEVPLGQGVSLMLTARRTWLDLFLTPRLRLSTGGGLPSFTFTPPFLDDEENHEQDVGYHFYDLGAKVTWRVTNGQRLSLSVYDGGDRLAMAAPILAREAGDGFPGAAGTDDPGLELAYRWGNRVVSGRYHGLVGPRLFLTATGYYSEYRAREEMAAVPSSISSLSSDYRVRVGEAGMRVDVDFYHSLAHQFRGGIHVMGRDFASTLIDVQRRTDALMIRREQTDRVRAVELVAYVQDTWQPTSGWQIQPGIRVEYFGLGSYLSVNPRFHLRHALARDRLFLRAGLSRQTQPLHRLRDRFSLGHEVTSDRWVPASDRIRPAAAWQVATGVEWAPRAWLTLDAEIFGRYLQDVLLPRDGLQRTTPVGSDRDRGFVLDQYVPGTGRAAGIELSAAAERAGWRGGMSYSFSRTQERAAGTSFRPARYDAPHQVEGFLLAQHGAWTLGATATLRSGYPVTAPFASYTVGDPLNGSEQEFLYRPVLHNDRLPVYARVDLSLGYNFRLMNLEWDAQAQAYNLLNRRNAVGIEYAAEFPAVTATPVPGLPILPMISLRAAW